MRLPHTEPTDPFAPPYQRTYVACQATIYNADRRHDGFGSLSLRHIGVGFGSLIFQAMSKVSFRARQIDFNKPLPILKDGSDLHAEFSETALVNRGVPQIPSGMEKEEENEHHFVEVIHALQLHASADVKIPVPDVVDCDEAYQKLYPGGFVLPKQLVHIRTVVLAEDEPTEYDMDTEDEEWLSKSELGITPEKFEAMIDRLERGCGQKVMNLEEAKYLLQDDPSLVIAVYDYWLNKRVQCRTPLLFSVRQERRDGGSNSDPYVAFRRRSEKMQTRKNRKNDEQSYEKMLILRDQMDSLGFVTVSVYEFFSEILSRLVKREAIKEALIQCDYRIFEARYRLKDWDENLVREAETLSRKTQSHTDILSGIRSPKDQLRKRPNRKRKLTQRALSLSTRTQSSEELSDTDKTGSSPKEPFAFVRLPGCRYLKPRDVVNDAPPKLPPTFTSHPSLRYTLTTVPSTYHGERQTYTGYVRRRLGRGGRIICDRLQTPPEISSFLKDCDKQIQSCGIYKSSSKVPIPEAHSLSPHVVNQSQALDVRILERLRSVVLAGHPGHPSCRWPVCTEFTSPPSFESLVPNPGIINTRPTFPPSPASSSPVHISSGRKPAPEQADAKSPDNPGAGLSKLDKIQALDDIAFCNQLQRTSGKLSPDNTAWFHSSKDTLSPVILTPEDKARLAAPLDKSVQLPSRVWAKLNRPYPTTQPLKQPQFPIRPRGSETSIGIPNGLGSRLVRSAEDRILLTDPSVLPSSKLCCLTRDCVSREPKVSGPQLQATNGVNHSQFCQLPT
ncbi:unnamed protein product [Calicophoron daubneyi]|uniref:Enhancer of polycomb-like protein n=1 Tax=Calicophoron daubneyi TaxID=300641 RepID=A0AAV2TZJ5_CALDB